MKKLALPFVVGFVVYAASSCFEPTLQNPPDNAASDRTARVASGQDRCATMKVLEAKVRENPGLLRKMQEIEEHTQRFAALKGKPGGGGGGGTGGGGGSTETTISIPVYVHVIYSTNQENISDAQIQSQIDVLNKDFRATNSDKSLTPTVFQSTIADFNLTFSLAGTDRKYSSKRQWGTSDAMKSSKKGGVDAIDPEHSLNIWVCNIGGGILGYAQFPGGDPTTDGIVVGPNYFGTSDASSSFYLSAPYDKGRTATHEIGHWVNLRHIWGDANCGNDFVNDTPTQQTSNGGCPAFPHVTCSNGPNGDMFMNYMDYTYDNCMYMFTTGQKTRARAIFTAGGPRSTFITTTP